MVWGYYSYIREQLRTFQTWPNATLLLRYAADVLCIMQYTTTLALLHGIQLLNIRSIDLIHFDEIQRSFVSPLSLTHPAFWIIQEHQPFQSEAMNINQVDNIFSFILLELVSCILACLENSVKIMILQKKKRKLSVYSYLAGFLRTFCYSFLFHYHLVNHNNSKFHQSWG